MQILPPRMITVNTGQAVRAAGRVGLGIIMQPEISLQHDFETRCLTRLFSGWRVGERPMWLFYFRDRRMTARLRSFIAFALATFGTSAKQDTVLDDHFAEVLKEARGKADPGLKLGF